MSRATVSYVLNDNPRQTIPASTRDRVLAAADRLGYAPSAAARTLRLGRSDLVVCLVPPWPLGSAAGAFLTSASAAFKARGLSLVVHLHDRERRNLADLWRSVTPAAVVSLQQLTAEETTVLRSAGIATVELLYSAEPDGPGRMSRPDVLVGGVQAGHLADRGHRRLGYAYPEQASLADFAEPRLSGVRGECAARGIPAPDVRVVPLEPSAAAAAITAWSKVGVTGICAYSDEVAMALLAGLRRLGLTAPGDVAIIGADDIPVAALASPPLTTVAFDHEAEADRIVRAVRHILGDEPEPPPLGPEFFTLSVRETT